MDIIENIVSTIKKKMSISNQSEFDYDKKINIGFGVDANYIRPMGVAITSLAENNPDILLNFYIFSGSFKENDLLRIEQLAKKYNNITVNLYEVNQDHFKMLPTKEEIGSVAPYFRIVMPLILQKLDTILYLDSDIVCLKNIEEIINLDMDDKIAAVILDIKSAVILRGEQFQLPVDTYFNSGVMKINIKKWNQENISEKTFKTRLSLTEKGFCDQDSLNIVLNGKLIYLSEKWNYTEGWQEKKYIPEDTIFLHHTISPKPWKVSCNTIMQPYYLKYERLSPWKDIPLELPATYREARTYARLLLRRGNILQGISWFVKYRVMKYKLKKNSRV